MSIDLIPDINMYFAYLRTKPDVGRIMVDSSQAFIFTREEQVDICRWVENKYGKPGEAPSTS